jgi:repressor LexA
MSIPNDPHLYTKKQGQYLSFIYYYTKVNGYPPAEADMQRFFRVSAPSVHQMIMDLERKRLISRIPRQARSTTVLLPSHQLPELL